jgi:hypothetical protein
LLISGPLEGWQECEDLLRHLGVLVSFIILNFTKMGQNPVVPSKPGWDLRGENTGSSRRFSVDEAVSAFLN